MLGERAIAASVTLSSGAASWFWKIAYDESLARYSPGVQLTVTVTQSMLADAADYSEWKSGRRAWK